MDSDSNKSKRTNKELEIMSGLGKRVFLPEESTNEPFVTLEEVMSAHVYGTNFIDPRAVAGVPDGVIIVASCGAISPSDKFACTKPACHTDDHEARGSDSEPVYETWPLDFEEDKARRIEELLDKELEELYSKNLECGPSAAKESISPDVIVPEQYIEWLRKRFTAWDITSSVTMNDRIIFTPK